MFKFLKIFIWNRGYDKEGMNYVFEITNEFKEKRILLRIIKRYSNTLKINITKKDAIKRG